MPSAYAYFRIAAADLPIEEISAALNLKPTQTWLRGDAGKYNPSRPDSGWCYHSPLPRTEINLGAHIEALLPLLKAREHAIRTLSERYETFLVCVGKYDDSASPGLFISRESVALLASLGVALDADLYFDPAVPQRVAEF
jgi:hypothetical protein